MATKLRRATPADSATIRDLTRLAYAKWIPLIGREPKPLTVNYDRAVVDHMIDLYEVDGEAVALIEVVPHEQHLLIENIAVRPNHQGRRIGELLLSHAETIARSLHLAELRLYTNATFISNIEFYKAGKERGPFHEVKLSRRGRFDLVALTSPPRSAVGPFLSHFMGEDKEH